MSMNKSKSKRIYLASPHMCGEEEKYIKAAFDTNWIAPIGPNVDGFENDIANFVGVKATVALSSGTDAIHLALKWLNVGQGDRVFCSSLTFSGSCNPILYQGAIPVFIDCDMESFNMSPIALKKAFQVSEKMGQLPKAVIVVNLYGQSADMDPIMDICEYYNVPIVEDAAESLGATYKGRYSGTFGKFGIYSFNGNKIITTSGGGMLVSNNEDAIKKARFWATQSKDPARHYQHSEIGYNYRMSNVLAGIGRGQLTVLNTRIQQKKKIYEFYKEKFMDIKDIEMMNVASYGEPNYWLSVITLKKGSRIKPMDIMLALENENIESRPVWKPMHLQPVFSKYDFFSENQDKDENQEKNHDKGVLSNSEDIFNRGVCLPSDTKMTRADMNRIVKIIKNFWINKNVYNEVASTK
ncbi:MAG: DegT/DnrJ/EryC1/StrS family aminotransferase [Clostridiaceae bacterium]